tara:strand:- start:1609 stop:2466 length:858 start_codon:yes stop_codon:yes gene_type:complete
MIYYICNCPSNIIIPINDIQAVKYYKDNKLIKLYNKKYIADSQNISNGDNTIIPNKFPIIVRPKVNLYGMGKDAYFIENLYNFNISPKFFWCEVFRGDHISVDIFFNNNEIQEYIAFRGKQGKLFTFEYWEYLRNYKISSKIKKWIYNNLNSFCGVFNMELINDNIIECHLRMGDINYFQNEELTNCVISCYQNKKFKIPELPQIYLLPVFVEKGKYIRLKEEDIYKYVRKTKVDNYVLNYFIDPPPEKNSNPAGGDRICNFTITNLKKGFILRDYILKSLHSFF